ncbi:MAG: hypothetical protein JO082_08535, partial [Mycobacterium sp.]|nr:hypothetical protein [Mycobacterium sp.]MBV9721949.1 hypothetical protein [Mycobacterium sp.]
MVNTRGIARLGMLAVGLGIGAAVASTPGTAAADSSSDWLSSVDSLVSGALPAPAGPSALNLDVSWDGYTLYDSGGSAYAYTGVAGNGNYDFAIASGADSTAVAQGGYFDSALANGTYALAEAGDSAKGATGSNFDFAEDIGNNPDPTTYPGAPDGAYAGAGSLIGGVDSTGTDSNDTAVDIGNNGVSTDTSFPGDGGNTGAFAGDGQLVGLSGSGNGDSAYDFGNNNGFGDGPAAVDGNYNFASQSGSTDGTNEGAFAAVGNNNTAVADTSYTDNGDGVFAGAGNGNFAEIDGPDNSIASAGGTTTVLNDPSTEVGNNSVAYILDPFGSTPDSALAGSTNSAAGSDDLAEVLFIHGNAAAQGADFLY